MLFENPNLETNFTILKRKYQQNKRKTNHHKKTRHFALGTFYQRHTVIIIRTTRIDYIRKRNHLVYITIQPCWIRFRQHSVIIKIIHYNNRILHLVQCLCHGLLRHIHANCKPIL